MSATLRCIGRTDSLGDPDEWGSHISFVYQIPGSACHTITLDEAEAQQLAGRVRRALWSWNKRGG